MNTKGWDTVCLVRSDYINNSISSGWREINPEFSYEDDDIELGGKFGCWAIAQGGSNKFLRFKLPIKEGSLIIKESKKAISLANTECIVSLMLSFISAGDDFDRQMLVHNFERLVHSEDEIDPMDTGVVLPISFTDKEKKISPMFHQVILDAVCMYLIDNPEQIQQVFAVVNIADMSSKSWVKPRECAYSYLDSNPAYLAVLGACGFQIIDDLPLDVDKPNLSDQKRSCFVVSNTLFLKNVMTKSLIGIFKNGTTGQFTINKSDVLTNKFKLTMKDIIYGSSTYRPVIEKLESKIEGDKVRLELNGRCDFEVDASMTFYIRMLLRLRRSGDKVSFEVADKTVTHKENIPAEYKWLFSIISPLLDAIVENTAENLLKSIDKTITSGMELSEFSPVTWMAAGRGVQVKTVDFRDAFYIEYLLN